MIPPQPLAQVLTFLPFPVFVATEEGELIFANDLFMRSAGKKGDDITTSDLYHLGVFDQEADFQSLLDNFSTDQRIQRILKEGDSAEPGAGIVIHALDLRYEDRRCICFLLIPSRHAVTGFGEITRDAILDSLPQFVFQTDFSGRIVYANQRFCDVMDCSDLHAFESLGGLPKIDLEYSLRTWEERIEDSRAGRAVRFETYFQRKDGTILPVAVNLTLTGEGGEERLTFCARDISDRRRREAELRAALLEVESLSVKLKKENLFLQQELENEHRFDQIVTNSPAYVPVLRKIRQVAPTDTTVLITGETGTGKELIARAIHAQSQRSGRPMITVNCAAIPAELIESELFGHKKGAFTGADRDRIGTFELADEGTLFLDEIGEMPLRLQNRLLRVLQDGGFTPVGGKEVKYTDVRVLAATNRNLKQLVAEGRFRSDLYFRLNVFPIHSIPLRERPEDIPVLLKHFLSKYNDKLNRRVKRIKPQDLERLRRYAFPGNIRELENIVERALILSNGEVLELSSDGLTELTPGNGPTPDPSHATQPGEDAFAADTFVDLETLQRDYIESVLRYTNGKVSGPGGAAEVLGLNPQTLFSKMRRLGVRRH